MIVNSSANLSMINVCDEEKGILKDEDMGNKNSWGEGDNILPPEIGIRKQLTLRNRV